MTRSLSVVLRRALGSICNGHPASEVVKYQLVAIAKFPISTERPATNQVVRSSSLSGRTNPRAIILKGGRVVFNIKENSYRLIIVVVVDEGGATRL
jgi:mRNA-degrading endonuclease HigB of HigAB toxin-antitoxin module